MIKINPQEDAIFVLLPVIGESRSCASKALCAVCVQKKDNTEEIIKQYTKVTATVPRAKVIQL